MLQEAVDALIDNGRRGRRGLRHRNHPLKSPVRHAEGQAGPVPPEPARQARGLLRPLGDRRRPGPEAPPVRPAEEDGARAVQAVRHEASWSRAASPTTSRAPSASSSGSSRRSGTSSRRSSRTTRSSSTARRRCTASASRRSTGPGRGRRSSCTRWSVPRTTRTSTATRWPCTCRSRRGAGGSAHADAATRNLLARGRSAGRVRRSRTWCLALLPDDVTTARHGRQRATARGSRPRVDARHGVLPDAASTSCRTRDRLETERPNRRASRGAAEPTWAAAETLHGKTGGLPVLNERRPVGGRMFKGISPSRGAVRREAG